MMTATWRGMSKPPSPVAWFGWLIVGWVVLGCVTLLLAS
jgi:hypothetical protein